MSRNYRGGGGGQRGGYNDPPGWGGGGQAARPAGQFAFGGAPATTGGGGWGQQQQAQPQRAQQQYQQPQQQNRFQALQGRTGGGGPVCYTCGQAGHIKRDCPTQAGGFSRVGGDGGRSRDGGARAPQAAAARVSNADARRVVVADMREAPPWPLSCYAPDFGTSSAGPNLLAGDVSFEEARAAAYAAAATGGPAAGYAAARQLLECATQRLADRERLAYAAEHELGRMLQAAAAGQPHQCAMPALSFNFAGGAPPPASAFAQSAFAHTPVMPVSPPQQQGWGAPQVLQYSPPPPMGALFAPQQAPPAVQQPQFGGGFTAPQLQPQQAFPALGAALPSGEAEPVTELDCWRAHAFRQGRIPEAAPPPEYA
jgi:hypothetical protein